MSSPAVSTSDPDITADVEAVDWAVVERGPVIVHELRLKAPHLPMSTFPEAIW